MKIIKILFVFSVFFSASLLTACHTVEGAGQDIQAGGHAISKASKDVQN